LGFRGPTDLVLSRVRGRGTSNWLVASFAPLDSLGQARLTVYVEAVSQALSEMTAVESSRLTWAMLQYLLPTSEALDRAAQGAMDALASTVGGELSLAVARNDGARVLTIGETNDVALLAAPTRAPNVLTLPIDVPPPFIAAIGLRRNTERPLAGREERLLQSAASTLGAWLTMVAAKLPMRHERRNGPRSFDQVVEQETRDAKAQQKNVSVMVVFLGPHPPEARVTHACVSQIRGQLRPSDMAGALSSGHIGVILTDTPADGAAVVADRLRRMIKSDLGFGPFPQASVIAAPAADHISQRLETYARVVSDIRAMHKSAS
jgi:hypothetical protein